ncbi:MAG: hypothetical protein VCC04_10875, partial [Myxococcota bacterium]
PVPGATGTDIGAVLKAAASNSNLNVVSAPHILTSDNEEAEIKIGNNIPIITSRVDSATGNTAGLASSVNVERQDIGVTLRVTPQISEGDTLRLKIFQQIEDINENLQVGVGSPEEVGVALSNRKVENTVVVNDGETVVIGGLISDQWTESENKVPFLGDIPGLGWAFKSTTKSLRKINLLIFLTPNIIRSTEDMEYDSLRMREQFRKSLGETYGMDVDSPAPGSRETSDASPVAEALREHAAHYPLRRKKELEALHLEEEKREKAAREQAEKLSLTGYMLRAEVFHDEEKATEALIRLIDAGYESGLASGESDGSLIFELLVGPYTELWRARSISDVLRETYHFSPTIVVVDLPEAPARGTEEGEAGSEPSW